MTVRRFGLDESKARGWLRGLSSGWRPEERPDLDSLIRTAQRNRTISGPVGTWDQPAITLDVLPDTEGDGQWFRYLVRVPVPEPEFLMLASVAEPLRFVGEPGTTSTDAAVAVLRKAVATANRQLSRLDAYVAKISR